MGGRKCYNPQKYHYKELIFMSDEVLKRHNQIPFASDKAKWKPGCVYKHYLYGGIWAICIPLQKAKILRIKQTNSFYPTRL